MEQENTTYLSIFRLGKRTLIIFAILGLLIGAIFSITKPLQYRSQASVLVIPDPRMNLDGYQATKSAEKYALTLSSVIPTMSFYNKVVANNPEIASLFSEDQNKQRKEWQRDVQAQVVAETGILRLSAYNRDQGAAQEVLTTAVSVLEDEGPAYLGGHSAVLIYMIDAPLASTIPVRPNYPLNMLGGIIAGLLIGAVIVFIRAESGAEEATEQVAVEPAAAQNQTAVVQQNSPNDEKISEVQPSSSSARSARSVKSTPRIMPGPAASQTQVKYPRQPKTDFKKPEHPAPKTRIQTAPKPIPVAVNPEPWITVTNQNKSQQI